MFIEKTALPSVLILLALLSCTSFLHAGDDGAWLAAREGDSVFVLDVQTGTILGLDDVKPVPAASLAKLFVMVEAFKAFGDGRLEKHTRVKISPGDRVGGAGVVRFAPPGSMYSWYELASLMIRESDNTAANILIKKLGMDVINRTARGMGFHATCVVRLMMDTDAVRRGLDNLTSARDVGQLLSMIMQGECLDPGASREMLMLLSRQNLPDKLGSSLPSSASIAHKTGELVLPGLVRVESDAGIIAGPGGQIVMVVIAQGAGASLAHLAAMGKLAWERFGLGSGHGVSRGRP